MSKLFTLYWILSCVNNQSVSACITAGYVTAYWNVPNFAEICNDSPMDDKTKFRTLIRLTGTFNAYGIAFNRVIRYFKWTKIVILSDNIAMTCIYTVNAVSEHARRNNVTVQEWIKMADEPTDEDIDRYLLLLKQRGRSMCKCSRPVWNQQLMLISNNFIIFRMTLALQLIFLQTSKCRLYESLILSLHNQHYIAPVESIRE